MFELQPTSTAGTLYENERALAEAKLKRHLGLPFQDKGIDSLALNLSVAVQAKDYANRVPGNRLGTFYMLAQEQGDKSCVESV